MNGLATAWKPEEIPTTTTTIVVDDLPPIVDAVTFQAKEIPKPAEIIQGILHKGSKLALGGGSKSFKTWVLLDLGLSVSHGLPWLGQPTEQGKVLYVNFELQEFSFQQRMNAVAEAKTLTLTNSFEMWHLRGHAVDFYKLLPRIQERVNTRDYSLIILDPIYKVYGKLVENATEDMATLMNEFERLAVSSGAAIAFGAHFSKGNQAGKESMDRISGSGVFARDPDSIMVLTKHEQEGSFTVEATLRNFPPLPPFVVSWDCPLMRRDDGLDPALLKQPKGRPKAHDDGVILDILTPDGLEVSKWATEAELEGVKEATFHRARRRLLSSGKVYKSKSNGRWYKRGVSEVS